MLSLAVGGTFTLLAHYFDNPSAERVQVREPTAGMRIKRWSSRQCLID
jgi:hypothetical protein